ncbi:MAG: ATP synthase F1 subunit gamma [Thermoleophilia bacterium]
MATLQDIRRRIASVENTRKVTKAMEMISAAKLRRAQQRIEALRPYAIDMVEMMRDLATFADDRKAYELLRDTGDAKREAVLVVTGDRGLAGAFNANVLRAFFETDRGLRDAGVETLALVVGKKGIGTLGFRGYGIEQSWQGKSDRPTYADAAAIAHHVIELFTSRRVDRVRLIYNHFKSPIEQTLVKSVILPIEPQEVYAEGRERPPVTYLYEPDESAIFESLLPRYVEIAIFRALLESSASEQGARMSAMRNASESADEMMSSLTLSMNRARQAAITQEILEVVAGAEALG